VDSTIALSIALIAVATLAGLVYRFFRGRGHSVSGAQCIKLEKLKILKDGEEITKFGKEATVVLFSTEYCGQCPAVRRSLAKLEYRKGGLLFIEVDITNRINLAAHFNISQTPTMFILNPAGEIRFRIGGTPKPTTIETELEKLGVK
jgi:thiol-disulfide isomerase/thioredoxin|tara:strand:- start:573 stop:1013 length:441 start_codon:yes stop_codon:yes gene_type:complete